MSDCALGRTLGLACHQGLRERTGLKKHGLLVPADDMSCKVLRDTIIQRRIS